MGGGESGADAAAGGGRLFFVIANADLPVFFARIRPVRPLFASAITPLSHRA